MKPKSPRILVLDIETSPNIAYVWGLWDQNITPSQLVEPTRVLCWAAKWVGEKKMMYRSEHHDTREVMLDEIHHLLGEADVVVTYNGASFDIPHLNREFIEAGLTPPAPYKQVDLYLVVQRRFKFQSNKLEYVVPRVGAGSKLHNEGFGLWKKCLQGEGKAWATMRSYNLRDVEVTEALYKKLLPWIPNHPNAKLYDKTAECPSCGHGLLQCRGFARLRTGSYQRYQCQACGAWSRDTKRAGKGESVQPL